MVAALVAPRETDRGEDARERRHEHLPDLELLGERTGMERTGAAEGDECEVARIVAALDRDHPQGPQHLGVHDLDHRQRVDPVERPLRRAPVELEPSREARQAAVRASGSRR